MWLIIKTWWDVNITGWNISTYDEITGSDKLSGDRNIRMGQKYRYETKISGWDRNVRMGQKYQYETEISGRDKNISGWDRNTKDGENYQYETKKIRMRETYKDETEMSQ